MHIHTVVDLWIGSASYPRCVADIFETDQLTISPLSGGEPLEVWEPGSWSSATTYDEQGYPIARYRSQTPLKPVLKFEQMQELTR